MKPILTRALTFVFDEESSKVKDNANDIIVKPSEDCFLCKAFKAEKEIREKVLNTPFLQGMKNGDLDPKYLGILTVLDSYYCYRAKNTLEATFGKYNPIVFPELNAVITNRYNGYIKYNTTFKDDWHIKDIDSVIPTNTMRGYADFEENVMRKCHPIYTLIAYLPCYFLWPWFSRELLNVKYVDDWGLKPEKKISANSNNTNDSEPEENHNVYESWFRGNYKDEDSFKGAWLIANEVEKWRKNGNFNEGEALTIFHTSMNYELEVFTNAYMPEKSGQ